ncbi:MAG: hypothetical protein CME06_11900 [Gemmatimonadetes bacterium]|nr:hypothetical protein [Gemmatimonadota bacterium]
MVAPSSQSERWLRIALRSAHIIAFSVYAGGIWYGADRVGAALFWAGMSGGALAAVSIARSPGWILELRGVATVVKIALIWIAAAWPAGQIPLLLIAIGLASVSSHMPGRYRYYSILSRGECGSGS